MNIRCSTRETQFIKQGWVRKRTRHTRRLGRRFLRLQFNHLLSFKRFPFEPAIQATCQWNITGSTYTLSPVPNHTKGHYQLNITAGPLFEDPNEEIELVLDSLRLAERWADWISRAAKFGSLQASLVQLPYKDLNRTCRGYELPSYLRPIALYLGERKWVEEELICEEALREKGSSLRMRVEESKGVERSSSPPLAVHSSLPPPVVHSSLPPAPVMLSRLGFVRFMTLEFVLRVVDWRSMIKEGEVMVVAELQGSEAHFRFEEKSWLCIEAIGGKGWAEVVEEDVLIHGKLCILDKVDQTDRLSCKVWYLPVMSQEGALMYFVNRATLRNVTNQTSHLLWTGCVGLSSAWLYVPWLTKLSDASASSAQMQWASVKCSAPWWHIMDPISVEPAPLRSELNYNDWLHETRKLSQLVNRITAHLDSVWWLVSFEKPTATFACLLYCAYCLTFLTGYLFTTLLLLPLLGLLLLSAPHCQDWQTHLPAHFPLALALLQQDHRLPVTETHLSLSCLPIDQDFSAHHGLLTTAANAKLPRYLFLHRAHRAVKVLFLLSTFGGLQENDLQLLEATMSRCKIGSPLKCRTPCKPGCSSMEDLQTHSDENRTPTDSHSATATAAAGGKDQAVRTAAEEVDGSRKDFNVLWWMSRMVLSSSIEVRADSVWRSSCLKILGDEGREKCKSDLSKFSTWAAEEEKVGLLAPLPPSSYEEDSIFFSDDDAEDNSSVIGGSPPAAERKTLLKFRLSEMSESLEPASSALNTFKSHFDDLLLRREMPHSELQGKEGGQAAVRELRSEGRDLDAPPLRDASMGLFPDEAEQEDFLKLLALQQSAAQRKKGKGGIRGIVRDVAGVSRHIIEYRRALEKAINLFSWAHNLATMTFALFLAVTILLSPFLSWSWLVFLNVMSYLRRAYHKGLWQRNAVLLLQSQHAILRQSSLSKTSTSIRVSDLKQLVATSEDFSPGPVRLPAPRGWFLNIFDHTWYTEDIRRLKGNA